MRVRVPGAARDFTPRVDFQCRLSYGVHSPPCAINRMHQDLCARKKNPKHWQTHAMGWQRRDPLSWFVSCEGQSPRQCLYRSRLLKRKDSRSGIEPRSFCLLTSSCEIACSRGIIPLCAEVFEHEERDCLPYFDFNMYSRKE